MIPVIQSQNFFPFSDEQEYCKKLKIKCGMLAYADGRNSKRIYNCLLYLIKN